MNNNYKELLQKLIDYDKIKEEINEHTESIIEKYLKLRDIHYRCIDEWSIDDCGDVLVELDLRTCSCCANTDYHGIPIKFFTDFDEASKELEIRIEEERKLKEQDDKERKAKEKAYVKEQELKQLEELKQKYES